MKSLLITPMNAIPKLLPNSLERVMSWVSWETPGHGTHSSDRARGRVQYILDMESAIRDYEATHNPTIHFSPCYCPNSPPSVIVGVDRSIPQIEKVECPILYPTIEVHYALCLYCINTGKWNESVSRCTYLVPRLHPSEHSVGGTGPFSLEDMLGGILCSHVEGSEPTHMLREGLRALGHLPHEFLSN